MNITAELNLSAVTIGPDEKLILVLPSDTLPSLNEHEQEWTDPLMEELTKFGLGDRVFVIYADGVQMAKVKQ